MQYKNTTAQLNSRERDEAPDTKNPDLYYSVTMKNVKTWCYVAKKIIFSPCPLIAGTNFIPMHNFTPFKMNCFSSISKFSTSWPIVSTMPII